MLNEIRSLISLILLEDKYKEMTGNRYDDDIKKFSKFVIISHYYETKFDRNTKISKG